VSISVIKKTRDYRSKKFEGLGEFLLRLRLTPNILTSFSLISGLLSAYFLFFNYWYFLLFALLHLTFDALDGVVARLSGETEFGKCFDTITDSLVSVLYILKVSWYLQDYFAYIITSLYVLALLIHFMTRLQTFMLFSRTVSVIVLIIATHSIFPYETFFLTLGYLTVGVTSAYSLARQLQWFLLSKKFK
jgi:phosphatidylglycerophosphate synthase